jgi:hypothetical protein
MIHATTLSKSKTVASNSRCSALSLTQTLAYTVQQRRKEEQQLPRG